MLEKFPLEWLSKKSDDLILIVITILLTSIITKLLSVKFESIKKALTYLSSITLGKVFFFSINYILPFYTIFNFIFANYHKTLTFGETLPFIVICLLFIFSFLQRSISELISDITQILINQKKHADILNGVIDRANELSERIINKNSQENQN